MVKISEEKYKGMFLKADDLKDDSVTVRIERYNLVEVPNQDAPADALYVDSFKRPLNLNKTNLATLVAEYGDETDAWKGKPIKLVKSMANNPQTGKQVETIRIKPYPAKK